MNAAVYAPWASKITRRLAEAKAAYARVEAAVAPWGGG